MLEAVTLNEVPSVARQRFSLVQNNDIEDVETATEVATRRRNPSILLHRVASVKVTGDGKDLNDALRISVAGRRGSAFTKFFALASTSRSFIERGVRPTLINAMLFFSDPNPDPEDFRRVISERLLDIPRFRSTFRFEEEDGSVHWDPVARSEVDIQYHVQVKDGRGKFDHEDIEELITETYLTDWDLSKPLWQITLVTNTKDGRSMMFCTFDHAIGDGVAMLKVMLSLLDDPPDGVNTFQKPRRKNKHSSMRFSSQIVNFCAGVRDGIRGALAPPSDPPSSLKIPKERLGEETPGKAFVQTKAFDLDEIQSMKSKLEGATVNDVMMAIFAIGLRRYFEEVNDPVLESIISEGQKIHAEFPVNLRSQSQDVSEMGSKLAVGSFNFPVNHKDPIDAFWQCKVRIDEMKSSPFFLVKQKMTDSLLKNVPVETLAKNCAEEGVRSTLVISNVIGPQYESSMAGYALNDINFTVTYPGGLYCGVLTYNGKMRISLILDKLTDGNVTTLRNCLESAYEDLKTAVLEETGQIAAPSRGISMAAKMLEGIFAVVVLSIPVLVARSKWTKY
uniref:Diacylglycerol O-acyltransferase n=1 Tax=Attheya septentrionalis TaxID=420275 RepID=A0A7S2ULI2_9STRA|mmetsp:Transcript_3532/g.6465  ORF Transcript_3532/g.6465 Transcript_3532/m.6465 type:complete len:563 (+) Transcript_3532:149-1837(+)